MSAGGTITDRIQGKLVVDDIAADSVSFATTAFTGDTTVGDTVADTLILKGRVSTSTAAGAALDLTSAYLYGEGQELRYSVSDWTGVGSSFNAMYLRAQTGVASSAKDMRGLELYGVANDHTVGNLKGLTSYAYIKGTSATTTTTAYGVHGELSFDAGSATKTITTEAAAGLLKITGGVVDTYTKIKGLVVRAGDMDGANRTYGQGILVEDDADMAGAITWTDGLKISNACTTGINLAGNVTTGLLMAGTSTTAISVTGNATDAFKTATGTFTNGLNVGGTVTTAVTVGACTDLVASTGAIGGNVFNFSAESTAVEITAASASIPANTGYLLIKVGASTYRIPVYANS